jgi:hypothetical protein
MSDQIRTLTLDLAVCLRDLIAALIDHVPPSEAERLVELQIMALEMVNRAMSLDPDNGGPFG